MAFFSLDDIKCSATTNRNIRRAFKKWHFNLCFELKKIEIGEVDQKLFYFDNENKEKICYILQYHYDKGKNAAQACEKICAIYGEDTLSKSAARK